MTIHQRAPRRARNVFLQRLPLWLAALFALALALAAVLAYLPPALLFWPAFTSVVCLVLYARDKYAAVKDRWRTPELTLHLWSLLGGWPGAALGQRLFNHKTSKRSFRVVFWCTVIANSALIAWGLGSADGRDALREVAVQIEHWLARLDALAGP
ncbi:DUF1294 domain-containing protein [Microbulbifer sp. SAOS-129_SWC]|uniref:DUF1294 domain-containing protein n=1 Tax=Microbulbifer sp. SAOS-129_SWC TaxID=3145235 RepID=UPI003216480C